VSTDELVDMGVLSPEDQFLCTVEPRTEAFDLAGWISQRRALIEEKLLVHAGVLFRRSGTDSPQAFERAASAVSPDLITYQDRAAPRTEVARNVYTSTEFAADQTIPLHHEMSYSHNWPRLIFFYCDCPASQGGRTPLVNDRKVFPLIDAAIKRRF